MNSLVTKLKKKVRTYLNFDNRLKDIERLIIRESDIQKLLLGKILTESLLRKGTLKSIHDAEFSIFSQWGDDGIIQYLTNKISTPKTFVDIGAGTYTQPDTRFLLQNNNWSGLAIDASSVSSLKNSALYSLYDITAKQCFVTAENINELISSMKDIGLLNIDIDGNDYWIWKAIQMAPVIVIVEYNPYFGLQPITVPYDKDFRRTQAHFSTMYYGASLISLCELADNKGYYFIGCNSNGGNAYFLRKDKIGDLKPLSAEEGFIPTKSREHRDENGDLTFTNPKEAIETLRGMPVFNTRKNKIEKL